MADVEYFLGIDPGKGGGIVILDHLGTVIRAIKMPATDRDLLEALGVHFPTVGAESEGAIWVTPTRALLERVSSSPQMGVVSAFTFGKGYGAVQMALTAARIPFDLVSPQCWQQAMGCRTGGDKNISKRRAQQLFPTVTVTHAIADALLLAEYCRRYWRVGVPQEKKTDGEKGSPNAGAEKGERQEKSSVYEVYAKGSISKILEERAAGAGATGARADPQRRTR